MDSNKTTSIRIILIAIAIAISFGAVIGFITGTLDFPIAVIIPLAAVAVAVVSIVYLRKIQKK